ncbi:MAG: adenosylcobinamide amidohydrolase [Acidimicrobiales bacterium]
MVPHLHTRAEAGLDLPYLVWRLPSPCRVVSSAVLGGGIGTRRWVLNAQVQPGYGRLDPAEHLLELAAAADLDGPGVGLLTAADVDTWQSATDGGARVDATVGVRVPTWAASPEDVLDPTYAPGTINIVAFVPEPLSDGALVNLVATATEAKTQALLDAGIPGTGTATDAVCVVSLFGESGEAGRPRELEPFGGPRSRWGSRVARAVHATVAAGTALSLERIDPRADPFEGVHP